MQCIMGRAWASYNLAALTFHRKCLRKRLGHQMYIWTVFVEECSMGMGSLYTLCWVSLIAGVGYRVEQWLIAEAVWASPVLPPLLFSSIMVKWSELGVSGDYRLLLRLWDQAVTEDQDAQTETKVKTLRSSTNICHHILSMHEDIHIIWWLRRQYGWTLHECAAIFSRAAGEWKYSTRVQYPAILPS